MNDVFDAAGDGLVDAAVGQIAEVSPFSRCCKFSRIRSKTMIVSWTEKPMTVSMAVTNRLSICQLKNSPDGERAPDDQHVVQQRDHGAEAVLQPLLEAADGEAERQVEHDQHEATITALMASRSVPG